MITDGSQTVSTRPDAGAEGESAGNVGNAGNTFRKHEQEQYVAWHQSVTASKVTPGNVGNVLSKKGQ